MAGRTGKEKCARELKAEQSLLEREQTVSTYTPNQHAPRKARPRNTGLTKHSGKQRRRAGGQEVCLAQFNPAARLPRTIKPKEEGRICVKGEYL